MPSKDSPKCPAHCLVIHVRFVFVQSPQARHSFRVNQLEDSFLPIGPLNITRTVVSILKQFQQELPQVRCWAYTKYCTTHQHPLTDISGNGTWETCLQQSYSLLFNSVTHNTCLYPCSKNKNQRMPNKLQQLQWKDQRKDEDQVKDAQTGVKGDWNIMGTKQGLCWKARSTTDYSAWDGGELSLSPQPLENLPPFYQPNDQKAVQSKYVFI